jgi:hypothetical protein
MGWIESSPQDMAKTEDRLHASKRVVLKAPHMVGCLAHMGS